MARGGISTTVVVIGGGCSGTLAAIHLLRGWPDGSLSVVIVEPETVGPGLAYSTPFDHHLLNSPATAMSAYPDRPNHFVEWAHKRFPARCTSSKFLPRNLYGKYLESVLADEAKASSRTMSLVRLKGKVSNVSCPNGTKRAFVSLETGGHFEADRVVLALGNLAPADPAVANAEFYRSARYVADPWAAGALESLQGAVLFVGTGLTAVDAVLALDELGHTDPVHAVSRRGLLPLPHSLSGPVPPHAHPDFAEFLAHSDAGTLRARDVLAWLRSTAERSEDWRIAVDHLRPYTPTIWSALPDEERSRFLRHALRYWEVHRHRMAPGVADRITALTEAGRFQVHVGNVERFELYDDGVRAVLRSPRDSAQVRPELPRVAHVVNCTGPQSYVTAAGDRLLDRLLVSGHVRPGPLGLGLDVDSDCAVIDARGEVRGILWAIGPLCKGVLWETTAVPEIRAQAVALSEVLGSPPNSVRRSSLSGGEYDRHLLDARDEAGRTARKLVVGS
jgi:uncharacterized NAD(P)/FAD-binding protein YdhS